MVSRRTFLKQGLGGLLLTLGTSSSALSLVGLQPAEDIENPLKHYPSKDWEKLYRDIYNADSTYTFVCTPNCTHNCYLTAYVKNGVVVRTGPTQNYHKATDLYGTPASQRWDPRICNKGLVLPRRFYGDRRIKAPMIRKGFYEWYKQGFPRDKDGLPPAGLFQRGEDKYYEVTWEQAFEIAAKALYNTAQTYNGKEGASKLTAQDYDAAMIDKMQGAGVRAMKFRGGMPVLGSIKLFGQYRLANSMALLDAHLRKVGPDQAQGAMGFDNYTWHTDLPPGHPMVTGQQTVDFDLCNTEYSDAVFAWGMNWLTTKMPDAHWLTEAVVKGKKVIAITTDYNATASKASEVIIIRPGTDAALALGAAHLVIKEKLYDVDFVKNFSDLPFLVRMDTAKLLKPNEIFPNYRMKTLTRTKVVEKAADLPKPYAVNEAHGVVLKERREAWGDFVLWDTKTNKPIAMSRDDVGKYARSQGIDPALEGEFTVQIDGKPVKVRPVFDNIKTYLEQTWTPEETSKVTWAPISAIQSIARTSAAHKEKTLFAVGMGPNQMFNADLKDRAIFLLATLTRNVGFVGGNVGSYAGNYRTAYFNGVPQYFAEDPFHPTTDPKQEPKVRQYFGVHSAHYYSHSDQPLRVHGKLFNGDTHTPTPTKSLWFSASNSLLGNAKGHYEIVMNLLRHPAFRAPGSHKRMLDCVFVNDWWWNASCEYADIVFAIDSWAEYNQHDLTNSCTNPFMQVMPLGAIKRIYNTRSDTETYKGVSQQLAKLTGDDRFNQYWTFIDEKHRAKPYIQRILDNSNMFKGYEVEKLLTLANEGVPAMMMGRTYPKFIGREQSVDSHSWYTKSGRLEFYRDEQEFLDYGENLPVYREPIEATFYDPNTIVAQPHPLIRPKTLQDYGFPVNDTSGETRQIRNVIHTPDALLKTKHPLRKQGYDHIWVTPKYRHSVHTFCADIDIQSVFWGPFGDMYRMDKRSPWVGEGYVDINPKDAKDLGIEDGDYIWVDGDPETLPFKGWQQRPNEYKVARCMLRARYYPGIPPGVTRTWFNMPMASFGTVQGHESRKDGLAKNVLTNYQSMYRYGGHQSGTRSWLRPTLLTDSLVRKDLMGQVIGAGFAPDVHCANGAPRESFVRFTKAESGGLEGRGLWRRAQQGLRPGYENENFKRYLQGSLTQWKG
jgi:nitrate reductase alpha subunit